MLAYKREVWARTDKVTGSSSSGSGLTAKDIVQFWSEANERNQEWDDDVIAILRKDFKFFGARFTSPIHLETAIGTVSLDSCSGA